MHKIDGHTQHYCVSVFYTFSFVGPAEAQNTSNKALITHKNSTFFLLLVLSRPLDSPDGHVAAPAPPDEPYGSAARRSCPVWGPGTPRRRRRGPRWCRKSGWCVRCWPPRPPRTCTHRRCPHSECCLVREKKTKNKNHNQPTRTCTNCNYYHKLLPTVKHTPCNTYTRHTHYIYIYTV